MRNLLLISVIYLFISCNKKIEPETPEKIFSDYKGSVVLIVNQYYYEINSSGITLYYSPSSEKKIFDTKEEVLDNLSFSTGTGFIISEQGEIITNRHVVRPIDENYKIVLASHNQKIINNISENVVAYNDSIERLKNYYYENSEYMSYDTKQNFENKYDELQSAKKFKLELLNFAQNLDFTYANVKLVNINIAVAYNDTYVTQINDLQECVVVKESQNQNIDLALIQTKTKTFNRLPEKIFNFNDNNPNISINPKEYKERDIKKPVSINADVYMIGFNRGFSLANTKQGIQSQFTGGKVSQENDQERILYTIPTLEGSSGSPIIDKWGNLVAVNYAKITNSQSFSFGIPVYEVKKFIEE